MLRRDHLKEISKGQIDTLPNRSYLISIFRALKVRHTLFRLKRTKISKVKCMDCDFSLIKVHLALERLSKFSDRSSMTSAHKPDGTVSVHKKG